MENGAYMTNKKKNGFCKMSNLYKKSIKWKICY